MIAIKIIKVHNNNIHLFFQYFLMMIDYVQICNILKEFDFIEIQEARDTDVLDRTVAWEVTG